jgi:putative membrane protein
VLLIKYLWEGGGARREQESALEILKKKYARGEISKEEFEEKKKDLL